MADEIDKANDRVQELLDDALAVRRPVGPPACGFCHFCNEPVAFSMRWCDNDCREDWQSRQPKALPKAPEKVTVVPPLQDVTDE